MMTYLKSEIDRKNSNDNEVLIYLIKEYIGLFDIQRLPERLKSLKNGAKAYFNSGYTFYQFHRFHRNKQIIYTWLDFFIIFFFLAFSVLIYISSSVPYLSIIVMLSGVLVRRIFISPVISANILHVNKLLEGPNGIINMKQLLELPQENEEAYNIFISSIYMKHPFDDGCRIQMDDVINNDDSLNNDLKSADFVMKLSSFKNKANRFNSMPMCEVIDFFIVMCCESCSKEIPQMTKSDFIQFMENAFINPSKKDKIRLSKRKLMVTYQIFHQFYNVSFNNMYTQKHDHVDRYISLLTDFIYGFDVNKVKNNFRTNDDYFLRNIREKYKIDLQLIQRIQTRDSLL